MQNKTNDNYFSVLRVNILTSLTLLIVATFLKLPAWVGMVGGGAPLVYYHMWYLAPRALKGLSQTAIDSVYYFGFLVTISALGVSAVTLSLNGGEAPLTDVAFQFGLGLLATGYAVVARMHLSSISTMVDEASPEAVLDQYIHRSREMVTNVELASTQFVELANTLMLKSQQVAEAAQVSTETTMLQMARRFDEELRGTLASAKQGLTEIRGLVSETSFVEEREALVKSVRFTLESVSNLNKSLDEFAARTKEGAQITYTANASVTSLNDCLATFCGQVSELGGEKGAFHVTANSLLEANSAVVSGARAISEAVSELGEMNGTLSGVGVTFKNIKTLTTKANEQLIGLVESAERLDGATHHILNTANASHALATALDRTAASIPELHERAAALNAGMGSLSTTVSYLDKHLASIPNAASGLTNVSEELKAALQNVAAVLSSANADAQELAGYSAQNAKSLEVVSQAAQQDMSALRMTSETVNSLLIKLATSVTQVQDALENSKGSLRTSITTATASLENDVKRSSEVARQFGERLTDVAQIVIDNTRNSRQPA